MVKTAQSTKVHVFHVLAAIFDAILNKKVVLTTAWVRYVDDSNIQRK